MNAPTPNAEDDDMRDEHLRAALRHAPDRDLRPSESVSAQILASAHRAAGSAGEGPTTSSWARWRERVVGAAHALRQPGLAAAFASLMLATVIGVMWRDGPPPDEGLERASGGAAVAVGASGAPASVSADSNRSSAREHVAQTAAPATSAAQRSAREAPAERAQKAAPRPARPPAAPKAAAVAPPEVPPTAAAPAAPAPKFDPAFERRAREPAQSMAAAPSEPTSPSRQLNSRSAPAAGAAATRSEAVTADAASAAVDPLGPLATAWAASSGERADAVGELRRLTQGRWALVKADDAVPLMSSSTTVPGPDGTPLGRLLVTENAVLWQASGTRRPTWRAPLPVAAAAGLRERLAPEIQPKR